MTKNDLRNLIAILEESRRDTGEMYLSRPKAVFLIMLLEALLVDLELEESTERFSSNAKCVDLP